MRHKNILIYIQQDETLHSLFHLETALHISGGTTTHHQERKQLYLQHVVFVRPLLLPAAIAKTGLHVSGGTTTHHQERKQLYLQHVIFVRPLLLPAAIAAGSSNGLTNTTCCRYSCLRS